MICVGWLVYMITEHYKMESKNASFLLLCHVIKSLFICILIRIN